ncbi:hypothetical protein APHAL10511_001420 [Amanita phalloides]|nr:hypothetical protein APHAL10511_001420 [Amanita phalloides]
MAARAFQAIDPVPGVKYRIQNVELLTCLELFDPTATSKTDVVLRPLRETDRQYWNNHFLALADSSVLLHTRLDSSVALASVWYKDGAYAITFLWLENKLEYYCYTDDSNSKVHVTREYKDHDTYRWQLVPVTSCLLDSGNYRIRNINGKSLLTMPEGQAIRSTSVYVRSQLDQSLYQRWIVNVDPSANHYTIQNAGNSLYLGGRATIAISGDSLTGLQNVFPWEIQSVGGFAWFLCIPGTGMSVSISDNCINDEAGICLIPSDTTASQIWFMEKYISICPDNVHARCEVNEGNYFLQSAFNEVYMKAVNSPWRITVGNEPTSQFKLKYAKENSARFTLTHVSKTLPAPAVADVGDYLGFSLKGTEFVLLEKHEGSPGYV